MAVGFVVSQLVAVEIPLLIIVLSELRVSPTTLAGRLLGVAAATARDGGRLPARTRGALELGVGMAGASGV